MSLTSTASCPAAWPPPADRPDIVSTLLWSERRDAFGHRLHVGAGLLACGLLPVATAPKDIALAILVAVALARLWATWRSALVLLRAPLTWCVTAWIAWWALSLTWTSTPDQGLDELGTARMVALPLALWPVIRHAPAFIVAALVGVAIQNGLQGAAALDWWGVPNEDAPRYGGLLHPIQTGGWCAAAIIWLLGPALRGRGVTRGVAVAALLAAGLGLLASGSRGPWIATALVTPLALGWIALRHPATRRGAALIVLALVIGAAGGRSFVAPRVTAAVDEYRRAVEDDDYLTSVGLRVGQTRWSLEVARDAPWIGVGAGGFRAAVAELPAYQQAIEAAPRYTDHLTRDHPHSSYLMALTTTGVIGLALLVAMLIAAARQTMRDALADQRWPATAHLLADGTPFVLLAWCVMALFETAHGNGHLLGLLMLTFAVTSPGRPDRPERPEHARFDRGTVRA